MLAKVSSGMKIVGAKDDSAQFAISEKMREQIRSLFQDSQNVQNGQSLFKIAEGGIENIVEELRTLKELAIKSANDINNDGDRLTIQKEFTQRMTNINDIATTTNYNGKVLLDGTYYRKLNEHELTLNHNGIYFVGDENIHKNIAENLFDKTTVANGKSLY